MPIPRSRRRRLRYRGAWAAFGIEFNFPVSHNWVTMSPVNFAFAKHDDGSASVTVGNIDRVYGMEWTVELILRPKSTRARAARHSQQSQRRAASLLLVEQCRRRERGMIRRSSIPCGSPPPTASPRFIPGRSIKMVRTTASSAITPKVRCRCSATEAGRISWGFGIPHTNTGTVHFAEYEEVPAKKIWSWGVDADGLDWRKALSDDNSGYLEVQAGLFRNQETYAFLEPRQVIHFSEYWMPVREIGGISRANLAGVASLSRKAKSLDGRIQRQPAHPAGVAVHSEGRRSRCFTRQLI